MIYITRRDDISAIPLSMRAVNILRRTGVHTIGTMIDYPEDKLCEIRMAGKKTVDEIRHWVNVLSSNSGEYILVDSMTRPHSNIEETAQKADEILKIAFLDNNGEVTTDVRSIEKVLKKVGSDNTGAGLAGIFIKDTPLSIRAKNSLINGGICFVSQLVNMSLDELLHFKNMGQKTAHEVEEYISKIKVDYAIDPEMLEADKNLATVFLDNTGGVVADISIEKTPLSIRAKNSLMNGGIQFVSQLVNMSLDDLLHIKNMGQKSADEVLEYISKIKVDYKTVAETSGEDIGAGAGGIVSEMAATYGQEESVWARELLMVKEQFPEDDGETLIYRLYESPFVRGSVKTTIMRMIEEKGGELSKNILENQLPNHLRNTTILEELLLELEEAMAIEMGEIMIRRQYPSIVQFVAQIKNERTREFLQAKLAGKTLQEIGDQVGITRERVRQLLMKGLRNRPYLREDYLAYIYENYDFSAEDIELAFDEPRETYNYLEMVSTVGRAKRKPIASILEDTSVKPELRRKAERVIYKNYITVDGVHVLKKRSELVKYFVKTYCKELTKFDDFREKYHAWIAALGLGGDSDLEIESRTYENKFNLSNFVLWNQWRSFRYYNISNHDYEELLSEINLSDYEDVEISALKLFRDYPDLMARYDIRDEYELHNLLKKIWPAEDGRVSFAKMPTIEIGTPNRDEQVLSLLLQYAPISAENFGKKYEETYGAKAGTVLGSYMVNFNQYFHNGIYSISFGDLPLVQFERMKSVLTEAFYLISDIKRLFLREFPDADAAQINPYTLKTLGYRVYSGYVIKNDYASAVDYFRTFLTEPDIVDLRTINQHIRYMYSFTSELYKLRGNYEIIEFAPQQYINLRRLNAVGISTQELKQYCAAVSANYDRGDYFTVKSLYEEGFSHALDVLGFDEWFYSSVLIEDKTSFSYQRIGGTRVILRGKQGATLGGMLTCLLEKHKKMDFYDLTDLLKNHYGIVLQKDKLLSIINGTELYYDAIMEAVYIDYDTYFEEI